MITIRRIRPEDSALLREVRLRALSDSPGAFGSTYARELAFDGQEWKTRAIRLSSSDDGATFFAFASEQVRGIIGCFKSADRADAVHIVSMWVEPNARRQGIGRLLLRAVEDWAKEHGLFSLVLDVVENNSAAIAFYESCGFRATSLTQPYPNDPKLQEIIMVKPIRPE